MYDQNCIFCKLSYKTESYCIIKLKFCNIQDTIYSTDRKKSSSNRALFIFSNIDHFSLLSHFNPNLCNVLSASLHKITTTNHRRTPIPIISLHNQNPITRERALSPTIKTLLCAGNGLSLSHHLAISIPCHRLEWHDDDEPRDT